MLRRFIRFGYKLILIMRYFPFQGIKKCKVDGSTKILFYSVSFSIPVERMLIGVPCISRRNSKRFFSVFESPHYKFIKLFISGKVEKYQDDYVDFARLLSFKKSDGEVKITPEYYILKFKKLSKSILALGYNYEKNPIVVYPRLWKNDFLIMDGAHRASILAAQGYKNIKCGIFLWEE